MESQSLPLSYLRQQPRWDFRYFAPKYLKTQRSLESGKYPLEFLGDHVRQIVNFGAYSLCNLLVWVDKGVPYLRVTDLEEDSVSWETVPHIPSKIHEQLPKSKVYSGDVLYSMAGTIGLAVVAPEGLGECNSNQAVAKIRLKSNGISPHYLATFFNSQFGRHQSERIANGQTVLNINIGEIGQLRIPHPPREVQDRIAGVMQAAYAARREKLAEAEKIEAKVNEYILQGLGVNWSDLQDPKRFTVLISELAGNRFDVRYRSPKAPSALNKLEKAGQHVVELRTLVETIHYGASVKNDYANEGIPFIRISNLRANELDTKDVMFFSEDKRELLGKAFVKAGDLLMSRSGSVGIVAVVPPTAEGFAFGSFQIKFRLKHNSANPYFIAYFLNSPLGNAQIEQQKTGSIQMNITIEGIKSLRVPLPDIEMQDSIVREANSLRTKAKRLRTEAEQGVVEAKARVERMILGEET